MESFFSWLKIVFVLFAVANVGFVLVVERRNFSFAWTIWRGFGVSMFLEALGVFVLTIVIALQLMHIPLLKYGWANLIFTDGGNVILAPILDASTSPSIAMQFLPVLFLLALIFVLPFLSKTEEDCFRRGHNAWGAIAKQSVKFGLVHLIVGIPLAAGLALSIPGFWLGYRYKRAFEQKAKEMKPWAAADAAVLVSTMHHTMYNTIAIVLLLIIFALVVLTSQ